MFSSGSFFTGLISGLIGAGVSAVVVVGGVTTYSNVSTSDEQGTNPNSVGYADD